MSLVLPKRWETGNPAELARQLDRLVEELQRDQTERLLGTEPRLRPQPKVNAGSGQTIRAAAGFGRYLPVDTSGGGTVIVQLPKRDDRSAGRLCGVIRTSTEGAVHAIAAGDGTVDGQAAFTLPRTVGMHLLHWSGADEWWTKPAGAVRSYRLPDYTSTTAALQTIGTIDLNAERIRTTVGSVSVLARIALWDPTGAVGSSFLVHAGLDKTSATNWQMSAQATISTVGAIGPTVTLDESSSLLRVRCTPGAATPFTWSAVVEITTEP